MKTIEFQLNTESESNVKFYTEVVRFAGNYSSKMEIVDGRSKVDLKSILGLMSLCLQNGKLIHIEITGDDEDIAEIHMSNFVKKFSK